MIDHWPLVRCDLVMLFFALFLSQALAATTSVLPEIFTRPRSEQVTHCQAPTAQKASYWSELMSTTFDAHFERANLQGQEADVYRNQLVTLSYRELFEKSTTPETQLMGYVYANASHHLGRLVRDGYWNQLTSPEARELARADRSLIRGATLGRVADVFPRTLSRRLMFHSVQLYKTLSWSLAAGGLCGREFVIKLIENENCQQDCALFPGLPQTQYTAHLELLKKAFKIQDFTTAFVAFEQSFLQFTMYQEFLVGSAAKAGILDPMRFISFNGEKQLAFDEWCRETQCKKTSANLAARTRFDQTAIQQEWLRTYGVRTTLQQRLEQSRMGEVSAVLLEALGVN